MSCSITLVNHATVLIQLDGVNILTDPVYSNTISFFIPRLRKPGIPFDDLPPIHLILVSHSDYDHLNLRTLRRLRKRHRASIVVPNGLANYARRTGFEKVIEMNWWDEKAPDDILVTSVPAQHSGTRMLVDRGKSLACGYVLQSKSSSVYFAGDTGYGGFLKEIGAKFSLDVALLPIGSYKPYEWFKDIHLSPQSAVQAFLDLQAKNLVPIHWGTFKISDEPMSEPPILIAQEAEKAGVRERIHILENGGRFEF